MLRFALNLHKPNKYAFFCPKSRMNVTVRNPLGFAEEVTPAILRALRNGTLIDVDNVVDLKTGTLKTQSTGQNEVDMSKQSEPFQKSVQDNNSAQEPKNVSVEVSETENTTKKRGRKPKNNTSVDEQNYALDDSLFG